MNVYISGHDKEGTRKFAQEVRDAGHAVVSTWHDDLRPHRPTSPGDPRWHALIVDISNRIRCADALVLIAGPETFPGGKFVEYGIALALQKRLYVLGDLYENGMTSSARLIQKASDL